MPVCLGNEDVAPAQIQGVALVFDTDGFRESAVLGEDAAERWKAMLTGMTAELTVSAGRFQVKNGAFRFPGDSIIRFGQEYDYRALVVIGGFGANSVDVAVYMKAGFDYADEALSGENSYILHFEPDALPPVEENGFWSITAFHVIPVLTFNNLIEIGKSSSRIIINHTGLYL